MNAGHLRVTYRYLRLALVVLVLALGVSVAAETIRAGWQTSISAYYYTAAGPVFVGALTAIGVCLVSLRGQTDAEDVALNLAGLSAPMVAFVPTPERSETPDQHAIVNSASTYLAVLAVGVVVVVVVGMRRRARRDTWGQVERSRWTSAWGWFGLAAVVLAWLIGVAWLALDVDSFTRHAHLLAALFTFGPFAVAVVLNTDWGHRTLARDPHAVSTRYHGAYAVLAWALLAVAVAGAALGAAGWSYAPLAAEIGLLVLFAVFWILQSFEQLDPL